MWQGFGVAGRQLEEAMLSQWNAIICTPVYFANHDNVFPKYILSYLILCTLLICNQPQWPTTDTRVSLKTQNVSQQAPNGGYAVSICGGPLKNFRFLSLFLTGCATHLWRGTILPCCNGKRAPGRPKISKFQKSVWYSLENRNACQKCPFWNAKKWHFERRNLRTDSKNLAKHPPKWWGRHLVHAFLFSGEYQANFWKLLILAPPGALLPLFSPPMCAIWSVL